jgi:hypothetical protein
MHTKISELNADYTFSLLVLHTYIHFLLKIRVRTPAPAIYLREQSFLFVYRFLQKKSPQRRLWNE